MIIVVLVGIGVSVLTQMLNKLLINEKQMDESKARMKELQTKLKTITDIKSKEFTQMQDEILDINFKMMRQQFKPMIFTFAPYLLIFYFMSGAFAYLPFDVGSEVTVKLDGNGDIFAECLGLSQSVSGHYEAQHQLTSTDCEFVVNNNNATQSLADKKEIVVQDAYGIRIELVPPKHKFIPLPFTLPYVGDALGWLGTFILTSLVSSVILGRALKGRYLRKWT